MSFRLRSGMALRFPTKAEPCHSYLLVISSRHPDLSSRAKRGTLVLARVDGITGAQQTPRSLASLGMTTSVCGTNLVSLGLLKLLPSRYRLPHAGIAGQLRRFVGGFPGEVGVAATEVAVSGGLLVNRPAQVQRFDNPARRQLAMRAH